MAVFVARVFPMRGVERYCRAIRRVTPDTLATIIFSSGSTGEPKGVMLSHFNVAANVLSLRQAIRIWPEDRLLGTLPFFHSFGYTVSLWGPVHFPFAQVFHLSPLDVKTIGELCRKEKVSIIVTTPTFLQHYLRRIPPAQFGGINCVITGAERLPDRLRIEFHERFGVEPLQGYGTTECAPVVSCNVDDYRAAGFHQVGHKRGSIGHPLPGIAVRVIHPETGQPLPMGEAGLLLVKGGNVMQGYLGMPEKTAEVIHDGWYNTGDVATIDEDGFVFITDRLSRFSKIGGEMAPHIRIEEKLHEALGLNEPSLVVAAVPDERKGEQLVVLHTLEENKLDGVSERLAAAGLPNLWIPRRENFFKIEAIPLLGSGKLDLQAVRRMAKEKTAGKVD
jgi:acyl-[acyl-carrier-protein]-phospholipid O-acyltransferase/long-chain-fatty-acid--[acyl-carrier-protein] ligase